MNLPVRISWRYLFARKSTNAINIITLIAAFGVAIGAAALILLLSVFNGFVDLFLGLFNNLNPDVRITTTKGKTFEVDEELLEGLYALDGVVVVSQTLEETAGFLYDNKAGIWPHQGG
jgi:lipoprotein-releasing system permease protein